jgi:hypothetical protein
MIHPVRVNQGLEIGNEGLLILIALSAWGYWRTADLDWRSANRESVGLTKKAVEIEEAMVQIYAVRAFSWRGYFGLHTWIAFKEEKADQFYVAEVVGWRMRRGLPAVDVRGDLPDRSWFGNPPKILIEHRGERAKEMIPKIKEAIQSYPYPNRYRVWPGPNSNTFVAYIIRNIPDLTTELPPNAVGKDFPAPDRFFMPSQTNTGYQVSVYGILGLTVGLRDGLEINLLGMCFGVDLDKPALKLPFIGRIGR